MRARERPKDMAPRPPPPPCICRMKNIHTAINSSMGNQEMNICISKLCSCCGRSLITTPLSSSSSTMPVSPGLYVRNSSPPARLPWMVRPSIITSDTCPCRTCSMKSEYASCLVEICGGPKLLKPDFNTIAITTHKIKFFAMSFKVSTSFAYRIRGYFRIGRPARSHKLKLDLITNYSRWLVSTLHGSPTETPSACVLPTSRTNAAAPAEIHPYLHPETP